MNLYASIVLAALLLDFALQSLADVLNLRALDPELPRELRDVYDEAGYRRSQEYTRALTRFGFLPRTFDLALLLVFWFAGGFGWLDRTVRGFGFGPVATGLSFIGALLAAKWLLALPFQWYSTFVIEERFGFNRTTKRTFVVDQLKVVLLAILLGGPLLAAVLWFFQRTGSTAWLWCWGVTAAFALLLQFVAPTWILPLFNRFQPLEEGELKDAILAYARRVAFPVEGLFVIDGSRRSTKANAFFTGFGRHKRIALFDTLVARHSTDELVAVVAHEIGHYKLHHIVQGIVLGLVQTGIVFFLLSVFLRHQGLFDAFGVAEPSVWAGLVFFGLLWAPIDLVLSTAMQAFSRHNEFAADRWARETTRTPERLISALQKISADSLSNLTPHRLYVLLHYSHPPLTRRVAALREGRA